jgi:hypothetical protein
VAGLSRAKREVSGTLGENPGDFLGFSSAGPSVYSAGSSRGVSQGFRAVARTILDEVLGVRPHFIEHQLAQAVRDPNGGRITGHRTWPSDGQGRNSGVTLSTG